MTCGLAEYAGATHTPPDTRTLHTATSARRFSAVVLDAVIMSPIACDARVILEPSFDARVFDVVGNVIVVSAVPASFVAVVSQSYWKFHEAEVVQDVSIQVRRQDAPDAIDTILFAHDELISKIPVLLLTM